MSYDQIRKIVVIKRPVNETLDENGFTIIGITDFLLRFIHNQIEENCRLSVLQFFFTRIGLRTACNSFCVLSLKIHVFPVLQHRHVREPESDPHSEWWTVDVQ